MRKAITITTDADKRRGEEMPLYVRFPGQPDPQDGRLYIEPSGRVTCGINPHLGGGESPEIYYRHILTVGLPCDVYGPALADWLDSPRTHLLLSLVVAGHSMTNDGRRQVGTVTPDAAIALHILAEQAKDLERASFLEVGFAIGTASEFSQWAGKDIAKMSKKQLRKHASNFVQVYRKEGIILFGDALEVLTDLRDEERTAKARG